MAAIFTGSIFFVYLFSCIAIINYGSFGYRQKISLIYVTNIGMVYTGLIGARYSLMLLVVILYLYEEFLQTEDKDKNKIITKPIYKIVDCAYMCIFKDYITWITIALFMNSYTVQNLLGDLYVFSFYGSVIPMLICFHKLYAQKYHFNTITDMCLKFDKNVSEELLLKDKKTKEIFMFISEIEDKSFYERKNSYNWFSFEFIKYRKKRKRSEGINGTQKSKVSFKLVYLMHPVYYGKKLWQRINSKLGLIKRGYSTIEMQTIRVLGFVSNPKKYVLRRKIFEIVYSEIFFTGVKDYYRNNVYAKVDYFKDYIMYEYLSIAQTKINGRRFEHFLDVFEGKQIPQWDINCVAAAVFGLNANGIYRKRLDLYKAILNKYHIDSDKVLEIANKIGNKNV